VGLDEVLDDVVLGIDGDGDGEGELVLEDDGDGS
jgi:hypothetical protein